MYHRPPLYLAISLSLIVSACNSDSANNVITDLSDNERITFTTDMAKLDKPYVTSLFYSNMQASSPLFADAKTTLNLFDTKWKSFKNTHENTFDVAAWRDPFLDIDTDLSTANSHYATINRFPADLTNAHLALEDVREVMKTMRKTIKFNDYLMDYVTDTHHKMEPISKAYAAYSASSDSAAINQLKATLTTALPVFSQALQQLKLVYGDGVNTAKLYELSEDKSAQLSKNISNIDPNAPGLIQIVANLEQALSADDNPKIVQLSSKIKGKFVSIFLGFGDFITPFKQDVIAMQKSIIPMLYCTANPPDAGAMCLGSATTPRQGTLDYITASNIAFGKLKAHVPSNDKTNVPRLLHWEKTFITIDSALNEALTTLSAATDLEMAKNNGAHLNAEAVREAFYYLIATYENTTTVITQLDEYHAVFEKMLAPVTDGNVSNADIEILKGLMPDLQTAFDNLSKQVLAVDKTLWGVTEFDLTTLLNPQQENIKQLAEELAAFDGVANDNGGMISEKVKALKELYIPLFKAFAAF